MRRILLVDDDFLALNAFFTLADWSRYGLSIAREAHNGQEAMDYLREQRPDIALSTSACRIWMAYLSCVISARSTLPYCASCSAATLIIHMSGKH